MRSWGEGSVIVDQSPGLLDLSVMRNTKIILRLPEAGDRALLDDPRVAMNALGRQALTLLLQDGHRARLMAVIRTQLMKYGIMLEVEDLRLARTPDNGDGAGGRAACDARCLHDEDATQKRGPKATFFDACGYCAATSVQSVISPT